RWRLERPDFPRNHMAANRSRRRDGATDPHHRGLQDRRPPEHHDRRRSRYLDRIHDAPFRLYLARQRYRDVSRGRLSAAHPDSCGVLLVLQLCGARTIAEGARVNQRMFGFEKADRGLMGRLFEPPAIDKMTPAASVLAHSLLVIWSIFVLFPIYWVIIT